MEKSNYSHMYISPAKGYLHMKFTHGYWVIRENFTMSYAQQWVRTDVRGDELNIKTACPMCLAADTTHAIHLPIMSAR